VKLARFRDRDGVTWVGLVDAEAGTVAPLFEEESPLDGQQALLRVAMSRRAHDPIRSPIPLANVALRAPVPEPPSIRDFYAFEAHVATARKARGLEMQDDWYQWPAFYFTNPAAVIGPGDPVWAPPGCIELDYELEVAAVVGVDADGSDLVGLDDWRSVVAGFCVLNDWSARDLQRREMALGLGPAKGKDFATGLGPWLVTPDEFEGSRGVMTASVDGVEWSRGELADLHHPWPTLLAQAGRGTRLRAGDVIGSGTVGTGCILELSAVHGPDRFAWLRPGRRVELRVEGIGALANPIISPPS
jgi:2-keto-4-pentenoate hydratase/2-oxohepta-3-ene-1,7-dioic acid hydratase in catechol pathway